MAPITLREEDVLMEALHQGEGSEQTQHHKHYASVLYEKWPSTHPQHDDKGLVGRRGTLHRRNSNAGYVGLTVGLALVLLIIIVLGYLWCWKNAHQQTPNGSRRVSQQHMQLNQLFTPMRRVGHHHHGRHRGHRCGHHGRCHPYRHCLHGQRHKEHNLGHQGRHHRHHRHETVIGDSTQIPIVISEVSGVWFNGCEGVGDADIRLSNAMDAPQLDQRYQRGQNFDWMGWNIADTLRRQSRHRRQNKQKEEKRRHGCKKDHLRRRTVG